MVFYASLDPAVIARAYERQPYGYQCLIAMLRGFMQNCCIIDPRGEVAAALAGQVRKLRHDSDRGMLDALLRFLHGHRRFVEDDVQADVVVSEGQQAASGEVCSLANFQFTNFEHERCFSAHGGVTLGFNAMSGGELLDRHFRRALQYAQRVQIFDGSLGQNCNENYRYTVETFLTWFRRTNRLGEQCPVEIHCREPAEGKEKAERQARLREIQRLGTTMTFYKFLPHD